MPNNKSAVSKGLFRVGVLLSFLWLFAVGGFAAQEGHNRNEVCAMTPEIGGCHRYFWNWEWSAAARADAAAAKTDIATALSGALQNPDLMLKHVSSLLNKYGNDQAAEYRLDRLTLAEALFAPLALIWGLVLGVAWCIAGFREEQKPAAK